MNQNFLERPNLNEQFYRAFSKYIGPTTSTPSLLSEYLSSAKTQTSNKKNSSNLTKPLLSPQHLIKPISNDSLRIKTQTMHFPQKQPVTQHLKSLSSDIKQQPQPPIRRRNRQEKMIFQSEGNQTPFLIISNKVRDSRRFDTLRKSTLPSIQLDSQRSIQNTTNKITDIPLVPIQQVTEIQDSKSQLFQEADKIQEVDQIQEKLDISQENQEEQIIQEDQKSHQLFKMLQRKVSVLEQEEPNPTEHLEEKQTIQSDFQIDEDEFQSTNAMKKLSVKMKFKNAVSQQVQTMFQNRQLKSLFTLIISPEFSSKHEEERQKISDQFESGNGILAKNVSMNQISNVKREQKIIQGKYPIRHAHKMGSIIQNQQSKLNTTNKAFQRKIQMIRSTQFTTKDQDQPFQQFSLLNKFKKQSICSAQVGQTGQIVPPTLENILPNIMDDHDKINITITSELQQNTFLQFNKPKFMVHMDTIIDEQVIQPIQSPPKKAIQHSSSLHSSFKLQKPLSISQSVIMNNKDLNSNHNIYNSIQNNNNVNNNNIDENNSLDFNLEFSKSNLYVRLYYQNRLHKLPQKVSFTQHNFIEIEDVFNQYSSMITGSQISFQTSRQYTKQIKTLEVKFLGLKTTVILDRYEVQQTKNQFSLEFDNSVISILSESDKSDSLDQILEEPNQSKQFNKNRPGLQTDQQNNNKIQDIIKSMKNLDDDSQQEVFVEDVVRNQKQISTGLLNPIKKVKNKLHLPLQLQTIMSILDQNTKNDLLTFQTMEQSKEEIEKLIHCNYDADCLYQLQKFYKQKQLKQMISEAIELRYESILIGRYQNQQRLIDVEHQDIELQQISEMPLQHQISSSQQSQPSQQSSQELLLLQKQKLKCLKQQSRSRNLQQRDSLTVIMKPRLQTKQTLNSPDVTNVHSKPTSQYTNQLTYNIFTQASTQYLTKPTNQSQQSVKATSANLEENSSHLEISPQSSLKSLKSKSALDTSNVLMQTANPTKIRKSQNIKEFDKITKQKMQKDSRENKEQKTSKELKDEQKQKQMLSTHLLSSKSVQNNSMFSYSLRMRNQALGHSRRQNLDQFKVLEQLIYDSDFQEFLEHIQQIPQNYINQRLRHNETLLTLASKSGCLEMVKELLKKGADINIQNDDGNTAVHLALSYGHYIIADTLIRAGANTNILNKIGKNAWSVL